MSISDTDFVYEVVSTNSRTLKIIGINPNKYNSSNLNWGTFPIISSSYTGSSQAHNGYGFTQNAFTITEIANNAFNGLTQFLEGPLTLPSSIERIGENAFKNVKISGDLTIPASVVHIGNNCFSNTLIDELLVENETVSDILSSLVDAVTVTNKETNERISSDSTLNNIKVPILNPTFTGTTTMTNAAVTSANINRATVLGTATVNETRVNTMTIDYIEHNISETLKNNRFTIVSNTGNLLLNENIEIILSNNIYKTGESLASEILSKLGQMVQRIHYLLVSHIHCII